MEIDITQLKDMGAFPLSHSQAEGGKTAGADTWAAAVLTAGEVTLLDTPEKITAFKDWVLEFGAWSREDLDAMNTRELNALFLQWVAGDVREVGADTLGDIDWVEYEDKSQAGQVAGNMFQDADKIYFSLDH